MSTGKHNMRVPNMGSTQRKILLLLVGGLALGMTRSPRYQYRIVRGMIEGWKEIGQEGVVHRGKTVDSWKTIRATNFVRSVDSLYRSKLVRRKQHEDGSVTLVLTEKGRTYGLRYHLETLTVRTPERWDGKWRVVMYDIPERMCRLRASVRHTLRALGFVEVQKSVFAHPYECKDQIEFLIEAYQARPYVRRMLVEEIDISEPLKKAFATEVAQSRGRVPSGL